MIGFSAQQAMIKSGVNCDATWSATKSLLHFNGSFADVKGKTWSAYNGSPTVSTARSKFGGSSLYLNGSSSLSTAYSSDFAFAGNDFTMEFWLNMVSVTGSGQYLGLINRANTDSSANAFQLTLNQNNSGIVFAWTTDGGTRKFATNGAALSANTWHHIAVCRVGTNVRVFLDGVPGAAANIGSDSIHDSSYGPMLGKYSYSQSLYLAGYMDELRIKNGAGLYSSAFTPPTAPFPDVSC